MSYEDVLIREATEGPVCWCSACERDADDCCCEELSDHFREAVDNVGPDVCVPAGPTPLQLTWPAPTSFEDWLQQHGDALPLPESFREWLDQKGYEIQ
jgi:hypothetical protein